MAENITRHLSVQDWAEIKRITGEIMAGMDCFNPSKFEDHVRGVLARNVMAASAAYDAALAAEETHHNMGPQQWEDHPISHCAPAYCGRYAGQRRDSRPEATS
jgi:hypothetical protein